MERNRGTIRHWNGNTWSTQSSSTTPPLESVWGLDANNAWAVGASCDVNECTEVILKWDGSTWNSQSGGMTGYLYGVWAGAINNAWAVGTGTILKWNGGAWSDQSSGTIALLNEVWGPDAAKSLGRRTCGHDPHMERQRLDPPE